MSADAWITLAVVAIVIAVLLSDRVRPVLALGGAVAALLFTGVIDTEIALSGLASPAPATIATLYVVAGAVTATGTFSRVFDRLLREDGSILPLTAATAVASSVVPNTPLVAMFAPRVVSWCQRTGERPARFLMPLSFASVLGGVVTLIGTSTNLVVSDLLARAGEEPLGVLEITIVGAPIAFVGVLVLSTLGVRLLDSVGSATSDIERRVREFQLAARVEEGSALAGMTIGEAGLRNLDGAFLAMIERSDAGREVAEALAASPDTELRAGDVCCFVGDVSQMIGLHDFDGLTPLEGRHVSRAQGPGARVHEAVVSPASSLVGRTLKDADFRGRYDGAVMAIHRSDGEVAGQLGAATLRAGDVLLVLAGHDFAKRWRSDRDFSLVAAIDAPAPVRRERSLLTVLATVGLVVLAVSGLLDLFQAALAASIVVVLGGALSVSEAWRSVNVNVVATMAVAISLGAAVAESGLAAEVARLVEGVADAGVGDAGLVVVTMLVTIALTELLTNTAAAALMVPTALSIAEGVGSDPRMLVIAVLFGASCSFLSPVGYQTNLMVYGLGGYRFRDFTRVGAPLTLSTLVVGALMIPPAFG